jgi:hypothetical protein
MKRRFSLGSGTLIVIVTPVLAVALVPRLLPARRAARLGSTRVPLASALTFSLLVDNLLRDQMDPDLYKRSSDQPLPQTGGSPDEKRGRDPRLL